MGRRSNYNPTLRKTEQGSKLYQTWRSFQKKPRCEEWGDFPTFLEWATQSGYEAGDWLRRVDKNEPFSPDNCMWYSPKEEKEYIGVEWIKGWNKTVNRIREHYGMPPLEGTEYDDL